MTQYISLRRVSEASTTLRAEAPPLPAQPQPDGTPQPRRGDAGGQGLLHAGPAARRPGGAGARVYWLLRAPFEALLNVKIPSSCAAVAASRTAVQKLRTADAKVWHGATENGP
jgi:hypothetical protein